MKESMGGGSIVGWGVGGSTRAGSIGNEPKGSTGISVGMRVYGFDSSGQRLPTGNSLAEEEEEEGRPSVIRMRLL